MFCNTLLRNRRACSIWSALLNQPPTHWWNSRLIHVHTSLLIHTKSPQYKGFKRTSSARAGCEYANVHLQFKIPCVPTGKQGAILTVNVCTHQCDSFNQSHLLHRDSLFGGKQMSEMYECRLSGTGDAVCRAHRHNVSLSGLWHPEYSLVNNCRECYVCLNYTNLVIIMLLIRSCTCIFVYNQFKGWHHRLFLLYWVLAVLGVFLKSNTQCGGSNCSNWLCVCPYY